MRIDTPVTTEYSIDFPLRSQSRDVDVSGSVTAIQTTLDRLATQRDDLGDLWAARKMRLDLCLQLRLFERDALEVTPLFAICAVGNLNVRVSFSCPLSTSCGPSSSTAPRSPVI